MGLAGEGLVDKRVMAIKTHFPERYGKTKFGAERCVLLVRSPLDCITSLFNMVCSGSHDLSIADDDFVKFEKQWAEFIEQEITVWRDFHNFWLKAKIPVHIIRYEDIVINPIPVLKNLCCFLLNVESVEGTKIEKYIELACKEKAPEVYKPRKGKVNANKLKFKPIQIDFMKDYNGDMLEKFGYGHLFETVKQEDGTVAHTQTDALTSADQNGDTSWISEFNSTNLAKSIHNLYESDEVTSILVNYPALLLRKKNELYPEGRTSYRFKRELRKLVTVSGKSAFSGDQVAKPCELDQPETDDLPRRPRPKPKAAPLLKYDDGCDDF